MLLTLSLCACGSEKQEETENVILETLVTSEEETASDEETTAAEETSTETVEDASSMSDDFDQAFDNGAISLELLDTGFIGQDVLLEAISPDGKKVIGRDEDQIKVYNLEKQTAVPCWYDEANSVEDIYGVRESNIDYLFNSASYTLSYDMQVVWSPDSTKVVLLSGYQRGLVRLAPLTEIYVLDTETGGLSVVHTHNKFKLNDPQNVGTSGFIFGSFINNDELYMLGYYSDPEKSVAFGTYLCILNINTRELSVVTEIISDTDAEGKTFDPYGLLGICAQEDGSVLIQGDAHDAENNETCTRLLTVASDGSTEYSESLDLRCYYGAMESDGKVALVVSPGPQAVTYCGLTVGSVDGLGSAVLYSYEEETATVVSNIGEAYEEYYDEVYTNHQYPYDIPIYGACFSPDEKYVLLLTKETGEEGRLLIMETDTFRLREVNMPEGIFSGFADGQFYRNFKDGIYWASDNTVMINTMTSGGESHTTMLMKITADN